MVGYEVRLVHRFAGAPRDRGGEVSRAAFGFSSARESQLGGLELSVSADLQDPCFSRTIDNVERVATRTGALEYIFSGLGASSPVRSAAAPLTSLAHPHADGRAPPPGGASPWLWRMAPTIKRPKGSLPLPFSRLPMEKITRLDARFRYLRVVRMRGVMQRGLRCYRPARCPASSPTIQPLVTLSSLIK